MTGWEEFTAGKHQGMAGVPTVRLTRTRVFYLNPAARRLLGDASRVVLLWDPERRRVGIRGASETTPRSYALTGYSQRGAGQLAARSFLTHYGLLDLVGQSFPAYLEGNVLVVPLASATDAGTAARS